LIQEALHTLDRGLRFREKSGMAKKKSKKRNVIPPEIPLATPLEMQAIFEALEAPKSDQEILDSLQSIAERSGMTFGDLLATIFPGLEDSQRLDEPDVVRPRGKQPGRRSRSSKSKVSRREADDLDELVEEAISQRSPEKTLEMLEKTVRLGEVQLTGAFRDHVGKFWLLVETRPYMRARLQLIHVLISQGQHEQAIAHMEDMLRLNPNDNQGVRWLLLEWYCNMNWMDKAWQLLARYPNEGTPFMVLTRICLEFQKSGPSDALEALLKEQLKSNVHMAPKLLAQEEVSPYSVNTFAVGEEDEADAYCQCFRSLWKATPGALPWLNSVYRRISPPEPELSLDDVADLAASELEHTKSLPSGKEIWFCDIDVLDDDGHSLDLEMDWDGEDHPASWLMSLINEATSEAIHIQPGEFPLSVESVLVELCFGMAEPDTGNPRRPKAIRIHDASLCQRLAKPLKRLKIDVEVAEERPELIQFLRSQRFNPELTPFPVEEILEVPRSESAIWEIDWRRIETWVPDPETDEPVQPWIVLVGVPEEGMIRAQQLSMMAPSESVIARVLAESILNPMHGEPSRPAVLLVRQLSYRLELEQTATSIGCDVVVGDCDLLDHVHQTLQENNVGNAPPLGALIQQPDVTPDIVGDFFTASAAYYKSRIYTRVRPELTVEVSCPEILPKTFTAVTMGQMGQEIGIMLFDNPKTVRSMFRTHEVDPEKNARKMSGIGYSIDGQHTMHPADVAAAEQFGWPVPSSETWPSVYYIEKGKPRELTAEELTFVTVAIYATLEMLNRNEASARLNISLHDRTVEVKARKVSAT
jgi:hypothetical protein